MPSSLCALSHQILTIILRVKNDHYASYSDGSTGAKRLNNLQSFTNVAKQWGQNWNAKNVTPESVHLLLPCINAVETTLLASLIT